MNLVAPVSMKVKQR